MEQSKNKKNNLLLSVLFFLIVFLFFIFLNRSLRKNQNPDRNEIMSSVKRGLSWLMDYKKDFEDPGILWAMEEINKKYCKDSALSDFVKFRWREFANQPVNAGYGKLLNDDYSGAPDEKTLKKYGVLYDDIILPSLYCKTIPLRNETRQKIFDVRNLSGYDATHALIAVSLLRNNGCELSLIENVIPALKEKILREEDSATFNDLYAERIAVLEYTGFKNGIKSEWIAGILKNQSSSGSWKTQKLLGEIESPHTTALATWALAQYAEGCQT